MTTAVIDGIATHYELIGTGPPLLMFSPGGFDASLDKWSTLGVYARIQLVEQLSRDYTCIVFDRRESGQSGGRIERITWDHYVEQGKGLLDHLGHRSAHLLGGCMGCSPVARFAVKYPAMVSSMVLYWPVGGAKFRINGHERFAVHLGFVERENLAGVVALARGSSAAYGKDPRVGPWAAAIRNDPAFADAYAAHDQNRYKSIVAGMARTLLDRDTVPGAEPEDLFLVDVPALIIPGKDPSHATSAARYLEECLPAAEYWDVLPDKQTKDNAPPRIQAFLDGIEQSR